jgi:hypothetical protein
VGLDEAARYRSKSSSGKLNGIETWRSANQTKLATVRLVDCREALEAGRVTTADRATAEFIAPRFGSNANTVGANSYPLDGRASSRPKMQTDRVREMETKRTHFLDTG